VKDDLFIGERIGVREREREPQRGGEKVSV
jgi:hypothetical protein